PNTLGHDALHPARSAGHARWRTRALARPRRSPLGDLGGLGKGGLPRVVRAASSPASDESEPRRTFDRSIRDERFDHTFRPAVFGTLPGPSAVARRRLAAVRSARSGRDAE